jgi:aspartyl-tRNA(Asn)/glutamyl-tRNA(Gln) amidotransferase subunit C
MPLARSEVEHVARLAHLGLSEAEIEQLRAQLSQIVDYFAVLKNVDTANVPPTSHTLPLENVMRADESRPSMSREDTLLNAPMREGEYFRVRKVLE